MFNYVNMNINCRRNVLLLLNLKSVIVILTNGEIENIQKNMLK